MFEFPGLIGDELVLLGHRNMENARPLQLWIQEECLAFLPVVRLANAESSALAPSSRISENVTRPGLGARSGLSA